MSVRPFLSECVRKCHKVSECVLIVRVCLNCPNVSYLSECVRKCPNASESVQMCPNKSFITFNQPLIFNFSLQLFVLKPSIKNSRKASKASKRTNCPKLKRWRKIPCQQKKSSKLKKLHKFLSKEEKNAFQNNISFNS